MSDHPPTPTELRRMGYPNQVSGPQSVVTPDHTARILDPSMFDDIWFAHLDTNGSYHPRIDSNDDLLDSDENGHFGEYNEDSSNVNAISFEREFDDCKEILNDFPLPSMEESAQRLAENDPSNDPQVVDAPSKQHVANGSTVSPSPKKKTNHREGRPVYRVARTPKTPRRGRKCNIPNPVTPRKGAKKEDFTAEEIARLEFVRPKPQDVLGGRGERIKQNPGNLRLQKVVKTFQPQYWAEGRTMVKEGIAHRALAEVEAGGHRFLDPYLVTGGWFVPEYDRRLEKVKQILRTGKPKKQPAQGKTA